MASTVARAVPTLLGNTSQLCPLEAKLLPGFAYSTKIIARSSNCQLMVNGMLKVSLCERHALMLPFDSFVMHIAAYARDCATVYNN